MNPKVDAYFRKLDNWHDELAYLRQILLDTPLLQEELKWDSPCYMFQKANIAILGGFKDSCVLSFFKGALLLDTAGILQKPGDHTQAARVIRFTNLRQIQKLEPLIKAYLYEAMEAERAGLKVPVDRTEPSVLPDELLERFQQQPELKTAFYALTPGRQRAYLIHFGDAKQAATRISRIEKYIPRILSGKGITDCTCGLSKKMPSCDGSHKFLKTVKA